MIRRCISANSEHGDEAVYDHAIEDHPAEEDVDAAGAEGQPSDTDDMFRPIDLQFNDDSWLFAAMGQGKEAEAVRVLESTEDGQCTLMMPSYCANAGAVSLASCEHVKATNVPGLRISQEEHLQKWRKFLDPTTGKRRLTCKCRQAIPEDVDLSERAREYQGTQQRTCSLQQAC
jgi:hypothetical protein